MGRQHGAFWVLLWAWAAYFWTGQLLAQPEGTKVVRESAGQPVVFQAMMNISVSTLVFEQPEFALVPEAWRYITKHTPYMLTRNFLLTSSGPTAPTLVDFELLSERIILNKGVTFNFSNVNLANVRRGPELGIEWFMLSEGAIVTLSNVVVIDLVCHQTPAQALQAALLSPKLQDYPSNSISILNSTCLRLHGKQRFFSNSIFYSSYAAVTTYVDSETGSQQPGYTLVYNNVTHVCQTYLNQQCVKQHGASYCWELQARQSQPQLFTDGLSAGSTGADGSLSAGAVAGIAVACCATVVAAAVVAVVILQRRSGRHRMLQDLPKGVDEDGGIRIVGTCHLRPSTDSRLQGKSTSLDRAASGSVQSSSHPVGISLGVLIGAGSFGRVYRARWHSTEVAVKVMTCSPAELPKVLREAELMMSMQHDNIVRALNCSVLHSKAPQSAEVPQAVPGACSASSSNTQPAAAALVVPHDSARQLSSTACCCGSKTLAKCFASGCSETAQPSASRNQLDSGLDNHHTGNNRCSGSQQCTELASAAVGNRPVQHTHCNNNSAGQQNCNSSDTSKAGSNDSRYAVINRMGHLGCQYINGGTMDGATKNMAEVWLVMEMCSGGSLKDAASTLQNKLDMGRLVCRLLEVARGMAYLHSHGVLHSDLKAANVLLHNSVHGPYGQIAKISDFGLSSRLLGDATHRSTQTTGTISHTAPEVLQTGRVTPAADVYSFGIMMWELFTSKCAFSGTPYGSVALSVVSGVRPQIPQHMPEEYKLLMSSCWAQDPEQRPDFDQIARCLVLMLDGLETIEGPLLDSGYLAAVGDSCPANRAENDAASRQQQEVMPTDTPAASSKEDGKQQPQQEAGVKQAGGTDKAESRHGSSGRLDVTSPGVLPANGSGKGRQQQQQQQVDQQYNVQVRQQQQMPPVQYTDSSVWDKRQGLSSRHIQDL